MEPLLTAAILWPSADVWNLICKRLGHPLSVWELAFCRLGRGRLLSAFWRQKHTDWSSLLRMTRHTDITMTLDHFRRTNRCGKCPYVSHISLCSCLLLLINRQLWPFFSEGCLRARNLIFSLLPASLMEAWLILTAAVIHDAASFDCVCGSAQACHTPAVETWLNLS